MTVAEPESGPAVAVSGEGLLRAGRSTTPTRGWAAWRTSASRASTSRRGTSCRTRWPGSLLAGIGDSAYGVRGSQYDTLYTAGAWLKLRPLAQLELGLGAEGELEPGIAGNRYAPNVIADNIANTLKIWQLPPATPDAAPLPAPGGDCGPFLPQLVRSGARGHERLLFTFGCYRAWQAGSWDPAATPRWSIQGHGPAIRLDPLGLLGGAPAVVAEVSSPDATPIAELHLALQQGTTFPDRLFFRSRGTDDVATFATLPGPGGLPDTAVAAGATVTDSSGTYLLGLNLFLVRVHP